MNVNTLINDTDLNREIAELRDHIKNPNHVVSDIIDDTYTDSDGALQTYDWLDFDLLDPQKLGLFKQGAEKAIEFVRTFSSPVDDQGMPAPANTHTDSRHREIDEASGHPTKYCHSGKNRQRPGNDGLAAPAVCQHGQRHA